MDSDLPESAEQTQAEIELQTLIRNMCNALRTEPSTEVNLCEAAILQMKRCDARLSELERNLKRFGQRKAKVTA